MPPQQSSRQAAFKAFGLWLAFYIFLAHAFVIWKWQTPEMPGRSNHDSSSSSSTSTANQQEMEQLDATLQKMEAAVKEAHAANSLLQEQVSTMGRLIRAAEQVELPAAATTTPAETDSSSNNLLKVRNLLKIPDLTELRSGAQVAKVFSQAVTELESLINDGDDSHWDALASYFATGDFTRWLSASTCSSMADLKATQSKVAGIFASQRGESLPVSFPETVDRIRETLVERVRNRTTATINNDDDSATTTKTKPASTDGSCLQSTDDVVAWLEAGIDALHKKKDLRAALLKALQEDQVDTSQIILDADLGGDAASTFDARSTSVNLRQLIDTPTLHQGSVVIDRLLDWVGGKHDGLDDALDKFVYAKVPSHDDRAVSRALVAYLLQKAGGVEIPRSLLQNKAGVLR